MEILWLIVGLLTGATTAVAALRLRLQRKPAVAAKTSRWAVVLVPTLVGEGQPELPQAALTAAHELAAGSSVRFYVFIEVPRTLPLTAPLAGETEVALHLIEAAEEHARSTGRHLRGEVQKVRDYSYGVVEAARQATAQAVVLQTTAQGHKPDERGQRGSSLRLPNVGTLVMLVHDRAGCDVLVVG